MLFVGVFRNAKGESLMRIWRLATLLLLFGIAGACSNTPDADKETATTEETKEAAAADKADKPAAAAPAPAPKPAPPKVVTIPAGTNLSVVLSTPLNSGKNKAGDAFSGNLAEPVMVDGKTVLSKGAEVAGTVVAAEGSGRVSGKASMSLALTSVKAGSKTVSLNTSNLSAEAESSKKRDAAMIGGGAGVGAAIGAITGGKKGAAIGAAVGGAGGTGAVLATKGKEVEYPAETKLEFTLEQAAKL
jgi:hypothetical protein